MAAPRRGRRIYVDMDDVLCETARGFLALLSSEYGKTVAFEEITSFDLSRSFSMSRSEIDEFMERAHRDSLLADLEPIPGALGAVEAWAASRYTIEIVTGRPPSTAHVSRQWLESFGVPYDSLTFLAKYVGLHSDEDTMQAKPLSELSGDDYLLAVEDSRDMAMFLGGTLGVRVALLDRPWNRNGSEPLPETVTRCSGWDEVLERFANP